MASPTSETAHNKAVDEPCYPRVTYDFDEQVKLLHSAAFTDFDIKCADHVFKVHRLVICTQSPFFQALAGGNFKEATDQSTTLSDEDPALLARYLLYLYANSYPETNVGALQEGSQFTSVEDEHASDSDDLKSCILHAKMFCFARRRCDPRLEKYALQGFSRNFWAKRPKQDASQHNLEPRGPTRTLKYHLGGYLVGQEKTLIVGTKNTRAEIYDLLSDFAAWSDISISQRRIINADGTAPPPPHRPRRIRDHIWRDSAFTLEDYDFDHQHLVVARTAKSNAKNLSLLSCVNRWQTKSMSASEQELIRFILNETNDSGPALREIIALDVLIRKESGCLIPDPAYRALQLDYPEFFLSIDSLIKPQEQRQCQTCMSIQPVIRQPCSCGKWSDLCGKDCLSAQVEELKCFCCYDTGTMKPMDDRSALSRGLRSRAYPLDPLDAFGGPMFVPAWDDY